jgi:DNA-binding CsgD family transcriptional regulator
VLLPSYTLLLRLEADRAERAAARRAPEEVAEARRRAAAGADQLDRLARDRNATYPKSAGRLLLAQAERSRLEGNSNPERWQAATAAWNRLERPFDAAYAGYRQAEALLAGGRSRTQAEAAVRAAHQTTMRLGAGPLRREIELLAQRGRLHLEESEDRAAAPEAPRSPAASLGLTQREIEVLALVAEGRTNRQIGQELFITPKTASLHVSRILAKLGVVSRGEAAASPPARPRQALIPPRPWLLPCRACLVASGLASRPKRPEVLATRCSTWPCHAVSPRSNALYDRCAQQRGASWK